MSVVLKGRGRAMREWNRWRTRRRGGKSSRNRKR